MNLNKVSPTISSKNTNYKSNAKNQIIALEQRVEELERELFRIPEEQKAKQDSDEDLDIEDEPSASRKVGALPDIRVTKNKAKGNKVELMLKQIKEKDQEILLLKDEVRKQQMMVKAKDKEIMRTKAKIKKLGSTTVDSTKM